MSHDYKRNGTATLFAALDVLDGRVIGRCTQRHRHQELICFLNGPPVLRAPARKPDATLRSRRDAAPKVRLASDSPLEGDGFEHSVPAGGSIVVAG
jgi:hypothetical protein